MSSALLIFEPFRLAEDKGTIFGGTLQQFVECTIEGEEIDPNVVVRNVSVFLFIKVSEGGGEVF